MAAQLGQQAARVARCGCLLDICHGTHARFFFLGSLQHRRQAGRELPEGWACSRVLVPCGGHELCQHGGAVWGDAWAQPFLYHTHSRLQWGHVTVRHLAGQQLPDDNRKGEDVGLLAIRLVLNDLWRHPAVGAGLCSHVACPNDACHAKISDLDDPMLIHEQVGCLQVSVHDFALVQVVHAPGHLQRHLEYLGKAHLALPADVVVHAAARHELKHDAQVGLARACADELHHILVADLAHDGHLLQEFLVLAGVILHVL
mmetsp:Transcript_22890/g.63243  ORF Transcript_22890/g.63243 Transcript_22890/m.63243 type:complete len:258 (-) Transcript_22890:1432-2205(-)